MMNGRYLYLVGLSLVDTGLVWMVISLQACMASRRLLTLQALMLLLLQSGRASDH